MTKNINIDWKIEISKRELIAAAIVFLTLMVFVYVFIAPSNRPGTINCLSGCPEESVAVKCKDIHGNDGRSCTTIVGKEFDANVLKLWCSTRYDKEN